MSRNRVLHAHHAPFSSICLLEMYRKSKSGDAVSFVNRSTGFLIADNVLVTAGHSLSEKDTVIERIEIYPYQNSPQKSERKVRVESTDFVIRKVPEYDNPFCYVKDDFGIIFLKKDKIISPDTFHFDWQPFEPGHTGVKENDLIRMAGYPIDKPDFELWEERGHIVEITSQCLLHSFTTTKRNSGSPIWAEHNTGMQLVGIHVSGNAASCHAKPQNRPYGSAVLLTARVVETIMSWIGEESRKR
ncbi:trypsin-like serine peptidase [Arundinibacter roseus]|uniref:Peptidase S1 domain-containing protein n=1 Tax=Arundinibacter roseus TaxID=2070510 RepID=A0A4R4KFA0_9BACT|nr:trypsin-like serine protease [Arundinibacter roseus]TDB65159.1 hypothetical protein EZE20_10640 [Arundinibacter roseus]